MSEYFSKATPLAEAVENIKKDGGQWRKVEFYTKSCTDEVFNRLTTLDGLANVSIFKPEVQQKHLSIELLPRITKED